MINDNHNNTVNLIQINPIFNNNKIDRQYVKTISTVTESKDLYNRTRELFEGTKTSNPKYFRKIYF